MCFCGVVSTAELEMSIHAFISSRSDYYNPLFSSLSVAALNRSQVFQNTAARLLTGTNRGSRITPFTPLAPCSF